MTTPSEAQRRALQTLQATYGSAAAQRMLRDLGCRAAAKYLEDSRLRRLCWQSLDSGATRAETRDRLVSSGMSERNAYRLVSAVLCQRQAELARATARIDP